MTRVRMTTKRYSAAQTVLELARADITAIGDKEVYATSSKAELEEGWTWLQEQLLKHKPKKKSPSRR